MERGFHMVIDKIKELADLEAKTLELKKAIARERASELAGLPGKYGYASLKEFIAAIKALGSKKGRSKGRKKRVRITPELKASIVKALKGKKAASAVAKESGVSMASVNLIKKAAGLVKPRK
jgi:hypothetical protein